MEDFVHCEGLYKKWDSVTVDISFDAAEASFTSIVGQSGSGKSTVLRLIAGLETSDSPHTCITLGGRDIGSLPPGKRECGMVFQNSSLFLHKSVQDNVGYGLRCKGLSKKESRRQAVDFLATFRMQDFARRYPETLSGGEAQRVALARTLIVRPRLVLLDEPLSALDASLRMALGREIRAMQQQLGFTAIMVTHDLREAKELSDRIIVMKKGKKVWEGESGRFSGEGV